MEVKSVSFDNKEIKYICFGSGYKALVIIPGISLYPVSLSGDTLEEGFKEFKKEYTIYLFDRNTDIPDGYSVIDFTNDLAYAMKSLSISNADIYGASQGAMIGLALAFYYPELVDKLVLGSTAAKLDDKGRSILQAWSRLIKEKKYKELNDSFWNALFTPEYIEKYKGTFDNFHVNASEKDFIRFSRQIDACVDVDLTNELSGIRKPIFVMAAAQDPIFGIKSFEEIINKTGAVGYMFDNYYHAVYDEAPEYRRYAYSFLVNGFKK